MVKGHWQVVKSAEGNSTPQNPQKRKRGPGRPPGSTKVKAEVTEKLPPRRRTATKVNYKELNEGNLKNEEREEVDDVVEEDLNEDDVISDYDISRSLSDMNL